MRFLYAEVAIVPIERHNRIAGGVGQSDRRPDASTDLLP